MYSYRVKVDNPWNLFAVDENIPKPSNFNKFSELSTNSAQDFENFLSSKVPISFSGKQNVICCKICKVLVVKNRYMAHYDSRHSLYSYKKDMIPFENEISHNDKIYKTKKIKKNKKKRCPAKENTECSMELSSKKKANEIKVKSPNKRFHGKFVFDEAEYANKKKLKCEFLDKLIDKSHFSEIKENFSTSEIIVNKSYNSLSINDSFCYSNDSVHRTSSDSSTPPSLSLGTLQTLSSPSSLNILNDLSSVITQHYFLPSDDLTSERSGISCKYQIDSLPWENLPPVSNKNFNIENVYPKGKEIVGDFPFIEEDGEIERAVQSITGFYEFEITKSGGNSLSDNSILELKSDMFTVDDSAVIDCFLDHITDHPSDKDHISDSGINGNDIQYHTNADISQNSIDIFMTDCNNFSEYQIDSNLLNMNSDYEEKFETLINNTMNEFVSQSPPNIAIENLQYDRKKVETEKLSVNKTFDPLKHCGVIGSNGQLCYRSLLCKLHTMPQKRQVERSEDITTLIKAIRDHKKNKKSSNTASLDSRSSCSKMSGDSFLYNCSSDKSFEEIPNLLEKNLSNSEIASTYLFNCTQDSSISNSMTGSYSLEPQPLLIPKFDNEVFVDCLRPFIAKKSLLWKNRPKSECNRELLDRYINSQNNNCTTATQESCFQTIVSGELYNSQSSAKSKLSSLVAVTTNKSLQITSPGNLGACTNATSQQINYIDLNSSDSFTDQNSVTNSNNQHNSICNPVLTEAVLANNNNNKFLTLSEDKSNSGQVLYPLASNGQIMMVMNKNHPIINDNQVDLTSDKFSFSVNQSIPITSLVTITHQNGQQRNITAHNLKQQQTATVPTQQIVSISPLELQRITDSLCTNNSQVISTDCLNKANEIFVNGAKTTDKRSSVLYQINNNNNNNNNNQSTGQFISSSLALKLDSNNTPKPLTVQSSTLNGITQKFVILPDGTISAFSQASSDNSKTNLAQQSQLINRTGVHQYPIFSQLANCGKNQNCFLNGDKIIITPSQVPSNSLSHQIIMSSIINPAELNNQSNSRFTIVHPQQNIGDKVNYNDGLSKGNVLSNQISLDSSQQKLSFQIQTPNQFQNNNQNNTYIFTAAPTASSNISHNQQIFLQSTDQVTSDFSLIDSSKLVESKYNTQNNTINHFESVQCSSDILTINSANQDFEILNNVINPNSIIIQHSPINRVSNQSSLSHLSNNGHVQDKNNFLSHTSQDINNSIIIGGAQSSLSNNNNNQHIIINKCSGTGSNITSCGDSKPFAQSQLALSQRQLSAFSSVSKSNSVINSNQSNFKTIPPPLVISQQFLSQSGVSSQLGNKSFIDLPFQHQQSQQKSNHLKQQVGIDQNQLTNEFVIMQSMIA